MSTPTVCGCFLPSSVIRDYQVSARALWFLIRRADNDQSHAARCSCAKGVQYEETITRKNIMTWKMKLYSHIWFPHVRWWARYRKREKNRRCEGQTQQQQQQQTLRKSLTAVISVVFSANFSGEFHHFMKQICHLSSLIFSD
ncbi:hypothetical protein QVD17_18993 [Tagetes erecta]|uniref:Uncharacterized protein n=1 Tax=Tagetes erecta TaxID=13708 RepID=A0AAD8KQ58_TARER|nr:hypothetical protein QVD17_18993 [Tagetes erecta]